MEGLVLDALRPLIAGGSAAVLAYLAMQALPWGRVKAGRLEKFAGTGDRESGAEVGSPDHRTRLAFSALGIDATGREQAYLWSARLVAGAAAFLLLMILGAPVLMALAGFPLALIAVQMQVRGAWIRLGRDIEKEVPIFLSRLSSVIQIDTSVLQAIDEISQTMEDKSALRTWLLRFLARCQAAGMAGWKEMQAEAQVVSPSLGLAVYEIGRYWETGGPGYVAAFKSAADSVGVILQARAQAMAKGSAAKGAVTVILMALVAAMVVILRSPQLRIGLDGAGMQLLYAGLLGWMGLGWIVTNDLIDGAV